jgi:hypothetical protein
MEGTTTRNTLNWLFEKYHQDPNATWNIAESLDKDSTATLRDIHELGGFLVKKGYVKQHMVLTDGFTCSITTLGINQVSDMFSFIKFKILEASIERNKRSVMEILGIEPGHFKKVHDYATYLKRLGIIECIFRHDDVLAEPTFFGREWYNENKFNFAN